MQGSGSPFRESEGAGRIENLTIIRITNENNKANAKLGQQVKPHTLNVPKPMLPIAGKSIVQRLVEGLVHSTVRVRTSFSLSARILAKPSKPNCCVLRIALIVKAISATRMFHWAPHTRFCVRAIFWRETYLLPLPYFVPSDFKIDVNQDGVIWVQKVDNPAAFGVVKLNADNIITDFVEKPKEFVSDLAIIGIYYFKDGAYLRRENQYLLDHNIQQKGEFWLTDPMERMKTQGAKFHKGEVIEWLDCGNKDATVYTNQRVLEFLKEENLVSARANITQSTVISPCFIDEEVR